MENIQERLDEALELTFPASDPIALTPRDEPDDECLYREATCGGCGASR